jgi:hypothetical protein
MGQQITTNKGTSISPQQKWARRRNWEKRTLKEVYYELDFRLNQRWIEICMSKTEIYRSQTATDEEIKTMKHILSLMGSLIEKWSHNHAPMKKNINFKNFK